MKKLLVLLFLFVVVVIGAIEVMEITLWQSVGDKEFSIDFDKFVSDELLKILNEDIEKFTKNSEIPWEFKYLRQCNWISISLGDSMPRARKRARFIARWMIRKKICEFSEISLSSKIVQTGDRLWEKF